tara:strand:+ start:35350 stop:35883 length:534 start_codon:yes stop_codon:yes gene_type:complete
MKKIILIYLFLATLSSCTKNDDNNQGYPAVFPTYLILEKNDGSEYEFGDILVQKITFDHLGDTVGVFSWEPVRKNSQNIDNMPFDNFFIIDRPFPDDNPYSQIDGSPFIIKEINRIKYAGIEEIDELTIIDYGSLNQNNGEIDQWTVEFYFNNERIDPLLIVPLFEPYYSGLFIFEN